MKRRDFLKQTTMAGVAALAGEGPSAGAALERFKLGIITDEVSQDLERALKFLQGFALRWAEPRNIWGTYVTDMDAASVRRAVELLKRYNVKVSVLDTAFLKCVLSGSRVVGQPKDAYPYSAQMDLLKRAIDKAHAFGTDKIRIFTFWRTWVPQQDLPRVVEELAKPLELAKTSGVRLLVENEAACIVGTGKELAELLRAVPSEALAANWDPGNATCLGERPFPDGYQPLDKRRILHLHLKDSDGNECKFKAMGSGRIDYLGQFRALLRDGVDATLSLETHYVSACGSHEQASHESMQGLLELIKKV